MTTDTQDPTQKTAKRIAELQAHVEMLIALAAPPALFDSEAWQASDAALRLFLKQEHTRYHTEPTTGPSNEWYRENVSGLSDGDLECDNGAIVSRGEDPGAYVQTWSWVPAPVCYDHEGDELVLPDRDTKCPKCAAEEAEDE